MRAMLSISLTGNVFDRLKNLQGEVGKLGLVTEQNRGHWIGFAADLKRATAAAGAFVAQVMLLKKLLPAGERLQTARMELSLDFEGMTPTQLKSELDKFGDRAFEIQAKLRVDMTEATEVQAYLKQQKWSTDLILDQTGLANTAALVKTLFPRNYGSAVEAAQNESAFMRQFGLSGQNSERFASLLLAGRGVGLTPDIVMHGLQYTGGAAATAYGAKTEEQRWRAASQSVLGLALGRQGGLSPEMLGTAIGMFITQASGVTPIGDKVAKKRGLKLWEKDEEGRTVLKGWGDIIGELQRVYGPMKDQKVKMQELTKIFGQEGARVATALINLGDSAKQTIASFDKLPDAAEKAKVIMATAEAQKGILAGTINSIFAVGAQKLVQHETWFLTRLNEILGGVGPTARSSTTQNILAAGLEGGTVVAGALGAGFLIRALFRGGKALNAAGGIGGGLMKLMGLGAVPANIVTGNLMKNLDKDLMNVFVVNWPATFGGLGLPGAGGGSGPPAGAAAAGGLLARYNAWQLAKFGMGGVPLTGLAGAAATAGVVGAGALMIYGTQKAVDEAKEARAAAEQQQARAQSGDSRKMYTDAVRANVARMAERYGWTDERAQAEVTRRLQGSRQTTGQDAGTRNAGVFSDYIAGWRNLLGLSNENQQQAADQQREAARLQMQAAQQMPQGLAVRVEVEEGGTRNVTVKKLRRDGVE